MGVGRSEKENELKALYYRSMNGDKESYEIFLTICQSIIKSYLSKIAGAQVGYEIIEEISQDVLLSIHEKKQTYRPDLSLFSWIYAISRHRYIDYYRKKKRKPEELFYEESLVMETTTNEFNIDDILESLTEHQKKLLFYLKTEGKTYEETAKLMNLSLSAVKVQMHRLVKKLQQLAREHD